MLALFSEIGGSASLSAELVAHERIGLTARGLSTKAIEMRVYCATQAAGIIGEQPRGGSRDSMDFSAVTRITLPHQHGARSNEVCRAALAHARLMLEAWRDDYNHHRPHGKLGWLTPAGYAARWMANEELEGRPSGAFDDGRIPVPAG